jgi:carboxypeptidase PM20D1
MPGILLPLLLLLLSAAPSSSSATTTYRPLWPKTWPTREDVDAAVGRVSKALTFETVSVAPPASSGGGGGGAPPAPVRALHAHLARSYPAVFGSGAGGMKRGGGSWWPLTTTDAPSSDAPPPPPPRVTAERLGCGALSLLITVRGSSADPSLKPVLLVSHLDVVAAPAASNWTHPPFSGDVSDGSVWGRGAIDVKGPALALLEALQSLLADGAGGAGEKRAPWRPRRTVLVALGHDEEVGGACGAQRVAAHLRTTLEGDAPSSSASSSSRHRHHRRPLIHTLWDEGPGVMLDGVPPLVSRPTALIGTAEKRAVRVVVRARAAGGHASMPPVPALGAAKKQPQKEGQKTRPDDVGFTVGAALGRILAAIDATPPKAELRPPTTDMLLAAAPHADTPSLRLLLPLAVRLPFSRPAVARSLSRASAGAAAMVRTTVVATRLSAGAAAGENVMPQVGEATFNVRLLPGWGSGKLRAYFERRVEEALGGKEGARGVVEVEVGGGGYDGSGEEEGEGGGGSVAPSDGAAYGALKAAIERCWRFEKEEGGSESSSSSAAPPLVAPTLLTGMTDSRNYAHLVASGGRGRGGGGRGRAGGGGGGILRFLPVGLSRASLARIHGTDERLDVGDLARAMCTYRVGIQALGDLPADDGEEGGGGGGGGSGAARSEL